MIIVFLGPPGAGKGTQSELLGEQHGFYHFDTGSRLRAEIATGSELGQRIASFTDRGQLVPLEIIRDLILKFLQSVGDGNIMFDGFPRNLEQAAVLAEGLDELGQELDHAIYLEIDEDSLLNRIINRRFCTECGEIYNLVSRPPKIDGVCDIEGAPLKQRQDDSAEIFGTRVKVYLNETKPVLDYYTEIGKLRTVDGDKDIADVTEQVAKVLGL